MTPAPEQVRAREYLHRKGTAAPKAELRQSLAAAFRQLEDLLDSVPPELRARRPAPAAWSVHEIADHLAESHRPAVAQLAALIAGRAVDEPIPASILSPAPLSRPWAELRGELAGIHRDIDRLFDAAPETPAAGAEARVVMVIKVQRDDGSQEPVASEASLDWKAYAQGLRIHSLQHGAQVQRTLETLRAAAGP